MKSLGVMSAERSEIAPELPTFREQGYDIIMSSLRGIGAPKGLPEDIHSKLAEAVRQATADPEFRKQAAKMFVPLRYLGPAEYKAEIERSEEHTSELQSLMRISYAVICLKKTITK